MNSYTDYGAMQLAAQRRVYEMQRRAAQALSGTPQAVQHAKANSPHSSSAHNIEQTKRRCCSEHTKVCTGDCEHCPQRVSGQCTDCERSVCGGDCQTQKTEHRPSGATQSAQAHSSHHKHTYRTAQSDANERQEHDCQSDCDSDMCAANSGANQTEYDHTCGGHDRDSRSEFSGADCNNPCRTGDTAHACAHADSHRSHCSGVRSAADGFSLLKSPECLLKDMPDDLLLMLVLAVLISERCDIRLILAIVYLML